MRETGRINERAGHGTQESDLIDTEELLRAYYERKPDVTIAGHRVVFGTSGHRGSSLDTAFNEDHIAAITQAIVEYRASQGTTGPLFVGRDTHTLSRPAETTALEVLEANGVNARVDEFGDYLPTRALSHAILKHNAAISTGQATGGQADGIVITPSHNPPRDGGVKYNPPHGGPADTEATAWIAGRANELLADGNRDVRMAEPTAVASYDFCGNYVDDLAGAVNIDAIRRAGIRIGADPLGGASVNYWNAIASTTISTSPS